MGIYLCQHQPKREYYHACLCFIMQSGCKVGDCFPEKDKTENSVHQWLYLQLVMLWLNLFVFSVQWIQEAVIG